MTSTRKARPASRWMGLLGAALAAAPGLAHAQILDLVYERAVMTAADGRCSLFAPEVSSALAAAQAQARGAALRAGDTPEALAAVERRARDRAMTTNCASPDLAIAARRVRSAFAGYARLSRIDYPGDQASWRADRSGVGENRWRLVQETRFGSDRLSFGLAGRISPGVLLALAEFSDGQAPYGARLLLRDAQRSPEPYLDAFGERVGKLSLSRRLPPRGALQVYSAEARSPAGSDLTPKGAGPGWAFRFPAQAISALAGLDPREAVAVEFLFPDDSVRRAYIEVGDFAAGRAFIALGAR